MCEALFQQRSCDLSMCFYRITGGGKSYQRGCTLPSVKPRYIYLRSLLGPTRRQAKAHLFFSYFFFLHYYDINHSL